MLGIVEKGLAAVYTRPSGRQLDKRMLKNNLITRIVYLYCSE